MHEQSVRSASSRASATARGRTRAREEGGLWNRPALLDLLSDLLLLITALAIGHALLSWFLARPFFPVREVVVLTPPAQVTTAQIEFAARSAIRGNFFSMSLDEVRTAFEKLPWVRRAEVRRRWPNAVELRLEEHQAVAYWRSGDSDSVHLVNRQGELFIAASNADLPEFAGPPGSAAYLLERYRAFATVLEPLQRRLVSVWLSAREAWQLELDDGMVIVLGREQDKAPVEQRLMRFVRAWPQTERNIGLQIATVDLRYQRGFALTPTSGPHVPKGMQ